MKKQKSINSNLVAYIMSLLPKKTELIDAFMENSHLCIVVNDGLKIKIKQNEENIKKAYTS